MLAYHDSNNKFSVRVLKSGQRKDVSRLSLQFVSEDKEQFEDRIVSAEERRKNAGREARFKTYVNGVNEGLIAVLEKDIKRKILAKVVDNNP